VPKKPRKERNCEANAIPSNVEVIAVDPLLGYLVICTAKNAQPGNHAIRRMTAD